MAHADAWQWTPDMIWFNNLDVYGTANYYVQKLYATHAGTDLIAITNDGKPLTGQNNLFASAVRDAVREEVYLKLVNTSDSVKMIAIDLKGGKVASKGTMLTLRSDDPGAVNSFEMPKKISPTEEVLQLDSRKFKLELPSNAFCVVRLAIN
jgi:alpha-N-arabinofuranosidase